jgi:hypothetical protein
MSELACNIVLYRPDPNMLAERFRYWHVDQLVNQADILINRCLAEFQEYSALDYAWNMFQADLDAEANKLGILRPEAEKDIFNRGVVKPREEPVKDAGLQQPMEETEIVTLTEPVEEGEIRTGEETPGIKSSLDLRAEAFQRKKDLSAPGQPFALNERRETALKRLCRDYEEAVNRACVAQEGLEKLYGYTTLSAPLPSEAETLGVSITTLAIWIRTTQEWLTGYHMLEHEFTRVISVRSLLNRNAWALLRHSRDSYSTRLQIPADLFRNYENCHIRGLGVSLVGEAGTVPWSMVIRAPEEALYERSGQSADVDQSDRVSCLLGRVENRRSGRPVEICGDSSLLHASPIGRSTQGGFWSLEIIKPLGSTSETFSHIEDVVLEIYAAGIPRKAPETA